jgi:hypothetical protein
MGETISEIYLTTEGRGEAKTEEEIEPEIEPSKQSLPCGDRVRDEISQGL